MHIKDSKRVGDSASAVDAKAAQPIDGGVAQKSRQRLAVFAGGFFWLPWLY